MLNEFLKVAYETQHREQLDFELVGLLREIPTMELKKIADGRSIKEMYSHLDKAAGVKTAGDGIGCFLDQFQGSPLFDQAIALEQEELQAEMLDQQKSQERRMQSKNDDSLYDRKDTIRLKKRLLELELAKSMGGGGAPPGMPPVMGDAAQGAGAMGAVPPEGVQDNAMGVNGAKTAAPLTHAPRGAAASPTDDPAHAQSDAMWRNIPQAGRGRAFMETMGDVIGGGTESGGAVGAGLGALHGAMQPGTMGERGLRALGHGAMGAGLGALGGGALTGGLTAPGAAIGAASGNRLLGTVGGGALGYGAGKLLDRAGVTGGMGAASGATLGGLGGLLAGARAKDTIDQRDKAVTEWSDQQDHEMEAKEHAKSKKAAVQFADQFGRELARAEFEKDAHVARLESIGVAAGIILAKEAAMPGMAGMGSMLGGAAKGLGGAVMGYAKKNPLQAAGTAIGAGMGALKGGQNGGGASGAALGALGGGVAGNLGARGAQGVMANRAAGQGLGQAAGNVAMNGIQRGVGLLGQ